MLRLLQARSQRRVPMLYHLVLCTKYRRKVLMAPVDGRLRAVIRAAGLENSAPMRRVHPDAVICSLC
jgi:hypothetical protein